MYSSTLDTQSSPCYIRAVEPRVSIVTLGVADLERSYRFYKDGLGLPTTRTPENGIVFFQTGGVTLALYPFHELADDVGPQWRYLWEVAWGAFDFNEDGSLIVT
jgi:catechol 2,3-dioxygenase-like lactoylglutathione lyase family enzyme